MIYLVYAIDATPDFPDTPAEFAKEAVNGTTEIIVSTKVIELLAGGVLEDRIKEDFADVLPDTLEFRIYELTSPSKLVVDQQLDPAPWP